MVILFTTYIPILGSYDKNYSIYLELTITHLQISHAFIISILGLQTLPINSFVIFRSSTKIRSFLDLPNPHFLFKPFDFKSNEFEFKTFKKCPLHFSWNMHIFASPGNLFPCPNSSYYLLFSLFLSLIFRCFC